jgi:hypothetical protein
VIPAKYKRKNIKQTCKTPVGSRRAHLYQNTMYVFINKKPLHLAYKVILKHFIHALLSKMKDYKLFGSLGTNI